MMKPPIVTEFSVYGPEIDCVLVNSEISASILMYVFMSAVSMFFFFILLKAYGMDVKDRWRVSCRHKLIIVNNYPHSILFQEIHIIHTWWL